MVENASGDWGCESLLSKGTTLRSRSRISKIILNYADNARCRFRVWKPPLCRGEARRSRSLKNKIILNYADNARCRFRTWKPPLCKGRGTAERRWRGCWELRKPLSNSARDEFSVTLKIAITIKIDVTEKLSRKCHESKTWQQTWFFRQTKTVACIKKVKSRCRGQK